MPNPPLSRRSWIAIGVLYALFFLYSVIVPQQILLGLFLPAMVLAIAYFGWRIVRILSLYEQKLEQETERSSPEENPNEETQDVRIERLKRRYADDELTEDEFEMKLEQLLTEDESEQLTAEGSPLDSDGSETEQERTAE